MSQAAVQQHTTPQYYDGTSGQDRYTGSSGANLAASPPSSRRTGRQSESGNGSGSHPNTPQQPAFGSPSGSASMSTPRQQVLPASPPADNMASSTYQQYYPDQASSSMPSTAIPMRTSGQQQSSPAAGSAYDSPRYSSRAPAPSSGYGSESDRTGASGSDRQRQQKSPREQPAQPSSGRSQRTRQAPSASRSQSAMGQTPLDTSLPRENSTVINRIVVDDPGSDIGRERQRVAEARPQRAGETPSTLVPGADMAGEQSAAESAPAPQQRSRQEHLKHASHKKEVKFGDYILGSTLGEGEFGKVKMGWKKDSTVQVAIKLIRKESLAGNSTRLPKIYREISILRELQHPNIVKLHEFIETERHMGIVLEYASGGELFDYILNHRYLKDPAARRLFAQLVSGVGYLHKKGIVHRDLKLENLLLDRNKNIIITDFGFANTFSPHDELGEDVERRITDKEFVKREGLDAIGADNHRRGDLMQTSCGSPCYAAPELVVSDGLYTGRKVDVWSCGVILYAMLAGYLPFDDDPANPEGDNINLLYKYIVSTPLTFPEYVSPHARDLLRRILVPDPRQRADLFEVARHSWLSEYSHVVGFIGSSAKSDIDIANSAKIQGAGEQPPLGRSASVREPASRSPVPMAGSGVPKQPAVASEEQDARNKQRDAKRRTVQVEYVAPNAATTRGEAAVAPPANAPVASGSSRTRARGDSQGPVEVTPTPAREPQVLRKEPPTSAAMPPPSGRQSHSRVTSESAGIFGQPPTSISRPTTGGTLGGRLPSRGNSYSSPVVATANTENAHGRFSQPKSGTGYIISSPIPSEHTTTDNSLPNSQQNLAQYQQQQQQLSHQQQQLPARGHKRSSTLGSIGDRIMGRSNSRRSSKNEVPAPQPNEKRDRKYPPVSMKNAMPNNIAASDPDAPPRPSTESKRRPSFSFTRKNSDVPSERRNSKRFSFLPASFSMNSFGGGKKENAVSGYDSEGMDSQPNLPQGVSSQQQQQGRSRPQSKGMTMAFGRGQSRSPSQSTTNSTIPLYYDGDREAARRQDRRSQQPTQQPGQQSRYADKALPPQPPVGGFQGQQQQVGTPPPVQRKQFRDDGYGGNALDPSPVHGGAQGVGQGPEPVERFYTPNEGVAEPPQRARQQGEQGGYRAGGNAGARSPGVQQPKSNNNEYLQPQYGVPGTADDGYGSGGGGRGGMGANYTAPLNSSSANANAGGMRPNQRKFGTEAYEQGGVGGQGAGSSSGARKVMDFFRRRGKDRGQV
ncbi:hypothetical protein B0A55_10503 [Friedmanniomyces simplex]|uniref:non-specific serine/threonine protein kinase n=1 Tax=Friedmanniomyces simplex TaxID=329884 RepID=A0A4U0WU65_9PEZI|nr:hypothetical protein B0A55_10503 [Friedmanniomyces simplex]